MFQSALPIRFWPYSILTATWLINRLPSRILEWKSPREILFGVVPDYSMMRPFGCLAYAANLIPNRGKFDSRSIKCVFIGLDVSHKGFLLFDLDNKKILLSKDVKFVTETFPFLHANNIPAEPSISYPAVSLEPTLDIPRLDSIDDLSLDHQSPIVEFTSPELIRPPPHSPVHDEGVQAPRRGDKERKPPVWMRDYTGSVNTPKLITTPIIITPPTFSYSISPALTSTYTDFLFNLTMVKEPSSFKEAVQSPEWVDAINKELMALFDNHTWIITDLPPGKKPIAASGYSRLN